MLAGVQSYGHITNCWLPSKIFLSYHDEFIGSYLIEAYRVPNAITRIFAEDLDQLFIVSATLREM